MHLRLAVPVVDNVGHGNLNHNRRYQTETNRVVNHNCFSILTVSDKKDEDLYWFVENSKIKIPDFLSQNYVE